ncbi:transient receptor potential cation channel subfamily A member 1-like [Diaphorina citri]|uniref:Transient receptor potential cation channel subfamily A member 1-like n=1 Tax=Diaphorina citri TaxID=121845 RepID=A0A3Q0J7Y3_DIACI|nr:transient receptor potential cation channel subfamily A member 1-like [Diaphorina citri]
MYSWAKNIDKEVNEGRIQDFVEGGWGLRIQTPMDRGVNAPNSRSLALCGVNTRILNNKKQAVLHLATELNKVPILLILLQYKDMIDILQGGEHGRTALHIAAIYDFDECARILVKDFGASLKRACSNGYYPIHDAAKNASSKTMEVFLQFGESIGCSREEMISLFDAEGNLPLHSAVHGGDFKAVELCLKSGAKISTQQFDLSTPVHLACSQGALDIVRLMFNLQPSEKLVCLNSTDAQKMTPLHCAAMFDRCDVVQYLIDEGADLNVLDKEKRSPLLLAASRGGWKTKF